MAKAKLDGIRQVRRESFFIMPHNRSFSYGYGFGRVIKIQKGNEFDVVYLNTGNGFTERYTRKFLCKEQQARKQISTLKINNYCMFFCNVPKFVRKTNGEMLNEAIAFWCAYVPTHFDRIDLEEEQQAQNMTELLNETQEQEIYSDFLSQFENNGDDDNEQSEND